MRSFSRRSRCFEVVRCGVALSGKESGDKGFREERVEAVTAASRILIIGGCPEEPEVNFVKHVASTLCSGFNNPTKPENVSMYTPARTRLPRQQDLPGR